MLGKDIRSGIVAYETGSLLIIENGKGIELMPPVHTQVARGRLGFVLQAAENISGLVIDEVPIITEQDALSASQQASEATAARWLASRDRNDNQDYEPGHPFHPGAFVGAVAAKWFDSRDEFALLRIRSEGEDGLLSCHFPLWPLWKNVKMLEAAAPFAKKAAQG